MNGQSYRVSLGAAAASLRAEHGFRSVSALAKETGFSASTAYRVEGGKELERSLALSTIEEYANAIGVSLGELFTKADEIHARTQRASEGARPDVTFPIGVELAPTEPSAQGRRG